MADGTDIDVFCEDTAWIKNLENMPRGKALMDHLAALNSITKSGAMRLVEPPIEQCGTWLRAFCHAYAHTDTPFDIVSSSGEKRLPKSVAICNLSGRYGVFYSEQYSLAKVLCLVAQDTSTRLIRGVMQVVEKAEETGGSVIVCFCLPFQASMECVHWTIRTIRKTSAGAVKDGELCFSPFDDQAREVPCTASVEHWSDGTLVEVGRMLANKATPVCLDRTSEDTGVKMTAEQMSSMIEMLKTDRRKTLELHKAEKAEAEEGHEKQLLEARKREDEATHIVDVRISKIASTSKVAKETFHKKMKVLEDHNASLCQQLAAQQTLCKERSALLNGQKLEHEQELKQFAARQKTLEAQVNSMTSNNAKQVAEHAKQRREAKESGAKQSKEFQSKVATLEIKLSTMESAMLAVEVSAKQSRAQLAEATKRLSLSESAVHRDSKIKRLLRAGMVLASVRMNVATLTSASLASDAAKEVASKQRNDTALEMERLQQRAEEARLSLLKETSEKEACLKTIKDAEDRLKEAEDCVTRLTGELKEARSESGRQKHLAKETQKRVESLERQLSESEAECKRVARSDQKRVQADATHTQTNTVNVSQSTAVYMAPQPLNASTQAHYHQGYAMDPALENAVSQLHSSLNCITALARSASVNTRQVDILQAKLDALTAIGAPPQCYYNPHANGYNAYHG